MARYEYFTLRDDAGEIEGYFTVVDGKAIDVWKGWSRLGGEGWLCEHGGRAYPSRDKAVAAEIRKLRAQARKEGAVR